MKSGIWIDSRKAWVLTLDGKHEKFSEILSNVEDTHSAGGYGGSIPYGAQVANPEDKIQHRKMQQFQAFYKDVIDHIGASDAILIQGPAEAKQGLHKSIEATNKFRETRVEVQSADSITQNQFMSSVRSHFK